MPIYEYTCSKCGSTIEVIQKFSDKPLAKHAGCGGKLQKLISQSAFQLKGSGWYVTDYARKGNQGGETATPAGDTTTADTAKKKESTSTDGDSKAATKAKESAPKKNAERKSDT